MTTRQFSYALKSKLPGGLCLIIIGTEGTACARSIASIDMRIEIEHTGVGIAPDQVHRVREKFQQFGNPERKWASISC